MTWCNFSTQIAMVDGFVGLAPPGLIWMMLVVGGVDYDPINTRH
jgi:hypothetical protein